MVLRLHRYPASQIRPCLRPVLDWDATYRPPGFGGKGAALSSRGLRAQSSSMPEESLSGLARNALLLRNECIDLLQAILKILPPGGFRGTTLQEIGPKVTRFAQSA